MATIASQTEVTSGTITDSASFPLALTSSPAGRRITAVELAKYSLGTTGSSRAFFGATPVTRPAGAAQADYTLTVGSVAATTVGAAVVTTAATTTTPYGYATQAQADDLVSRVNQLRTDVIALRARVAELQADATGLRGLLSEIRSALVTLGLIKGAA